MDIGGAADFRLTSIQLNNSYNPKVHVDKSNDGLWWIIAFDNYNAGELWAYDACSAFDPHQKANQIGEPSCSRAAAPRLMLGARSAHRLCSAMGTGGPSS